MKKFRLIGLPFILFLSACAAENSAPAPASAVTNSLASMSDAEIAAIKAEVRQHSLSYDQAMKSLDAEEIISHVSSSPNFAYTRRGKRANYDAFVEGSRNLAKNFKNKESTHTPIVVDLISPTVAISTYSVDETVTYMQGEKRDFKATVSWISIKENGEWKYIHGLSYLTSNP